MKEKALKFVAVCLVVAQIMGMSISVSHGEVKREENTTEKKTLQANQLYSKSCALTDGESDRVLYGKEEQSPLANASTTKIMTCILALEACKTDEIVTASTQAAGQPKVHLGMKEGEQFYLGDLLYALMLESFNDCAYAIAEHVDGSVEAFADRMNEKAKELGCENTHFVTPNGLDGEDEVGSHHTTAADLCRIMSYCTWKSPQHEAFVALTQTRNHSFTDLDGQSFSVSNKNAFLDMMDCAVTGKTGFTGKAGYCYVAAAEDGGRKFCIALLACGWPNNKNYKWADAKKLFTYGLENYHLYECTKQAFELPELEVGNGYRNADLSEWGKRASLLLYVDHDEADNMKFLKADWDEAQLVRSLSKITKAPVEKGDKMGQVIYSVEGQEMYAYDIRAKEPVFAWNFTAFLHALWEELT